MKKTITLQVSSPVEIFGPGNRILDEFSSYFPGLQVHDRGVEIFLDGPEDQVLDFERKFAALVALRKHKPSLTVYDVEDVFSGENQNRNSLAQNGNSVIVHTTDGRPIRARNLNQELMVKAWFNSDLVFATGPAGTGKTYIDVNYRRKTI